MVAALDAYAVVTVLPAMLSDLSLAVDRLEQASPILTGFLAGYVVAMPLVGAASDGRGRLPVLLACGFVFVAGSAVTAAATGLPVMVAGRVLQGLGGGALVPLGMALAADRFSSASASRVVALGIVSGLQEAGSVFGPLYGTFLTGLLGGWRGVFWVSGALGLVLVAAMAVVGLGGLRGLRSGRWGAGAGGGGGAVAVDWLGAILLGAGLGTLMLALYPDQPELRAVSSRFWPLLAAAVLMLAVYGRRQARLLDPLVPPALLHSRRFWGSLAGNLLAGAALMVALVDIPVLARGVYNFDQGQAGLLLVRFLAGLPAGALLGGVLATRLAGRGVALAGLVMAAGMFFLMSSWGPHEPVARPWQVGLTLFGGGLGFGLIIAPLSALVLELGRAASHGLASSLLVLARTLGMLLGLSALTAFGIRRFHVILGGVSAQSPCSGGLSAQFTCLGRHVRDSLLEEYREVFLIAAGLCLVAALVGAVSLRAGPLGRRSAPAEPS